VPEEVAVGGSGGGFAVKFFSDDLASELGLMSEHTGDRRPDATVSVRMVKPWPSFGGKQCH
jgi:hypothetical protein